MELEFQTLDVFSNCCFGGNQLAVVWASQPLSDALMQDVAAEFNIAETIFLFKPADPAHHAAARIFTPKAELKFAGHPSVGAAYALMKTTEPYKLVEDGVVLMEQPVGLVTALIEGETGARVASPQSLEVGEAVDTSLVAEACGLNAEDIVVSNHAPTIASCGAPLVFTELASENALARAVPQFAVFERHLPRSMAIGVHLYTRAAEEGVDYNTRMFAPNFGIPEDPATGAANLALVGLLTHLAAGPDATFDVTITQGIQMGRPSRISAQATKRDGKIEELWIGGDCVEVSTGILNVPG